MLSRVVLTLSFALLLAQNAFGAPTKLLSYQGRITDSNGRPLPNLAGGYVMRFRICDAVMAGTCSAEHEKTRTAIRSALAQVPGPEGTKLLEDLMKNGNEGERRFAAGMIAYQGPGTAVPTLLRALEDKDPSVQFNAREALQQISRGRDFGYDPKAWGTWWRQNQPK